MTTSTNDQLVTVSIASIISSGAGFGVVIGTGASCIIPSRVLHAADLRVGDLIRCRLIDNPNESHRNRTPFMVAYVDPHATATLRRAVNGEVTTQPEEAREPEQLVLPFEDAIKEMLGVAAQAPAPKRETVVEIRERVDAILDTEGMWTLADFQKELWPDEDFDTKDYRYKLLSNSLRDLHRTERVAAVGRRASQQGPMTRVHYTRFPDKVQIVWAGDK